jgi:putative endonuclease
LKGREKQPGAMHYLYIIYSKKIDQYYTGETKAVSQTMEKHNRGHSAATKKGVPWELKKVVGFETKSEAIKAEKWLKRMKSRTVTEQIIDGQIDLKKVMSRNT